MGMLRLDEEVERSVALSYGALPEDDRRALRLLASAPGRDLGLGAAAALLDTTAEGVAEVLGRLTASHLVRTGPPGRWELHDLIRLFARSRSLDEDPPRDVAAALDRMLDHYVDQTMAAVAVTHPRTVGDWYWRAEAGPTPIGPEQDPVAWLEAERVNLVAAVGWAATTGHEPQAIRIAGCVSPYLLDTVDPATGVSVQETALSAAERIDDRAGVALARRNLGLALSRLGDVSTAKPMLVTALAEAEALADGHGQAQVRNTLAIVAHTAGENEEAIALFTRNAEFYRGLPAGYGLVSTLMNLGVVHTRLGNPDRALELLREAIELAVEVGWLVGEQQARNNITTLLQTKGRLAEAEREATLALQLAHRIRRPLGVAYATCTLASVRADRGDLPDALRLNAEARTLATELGARTLVLMTHNNAGDYLLAGEPAAAAEEYSAGLALAVELGDAFEASRAEAGLRAVEDA